MFSFGTETMLDQTSNLDSGFLSIQPSGADLSPRQIPRGASWHWTVRCLADEPYVQVTSPITDVDVELKIHPEIQITHPILGGGFSFSGSQAWLRSRVRRL